MCDVFYVPCVLAFLSISSGVKLSFVSFCFCFFLHFPNSEVRLHQSEAPTLWVSCRGAPPPSYWVSGLSGPHGGAKPFLWVAPLPLLFFFSTTRYDLLLIVFFLFSKTPKFSLRFGGETLFLFSNSPCPLQVFRPPFSFSPQVSLSPLKRYSRFRFLFGNEAPLFPPNHGFHPFFSPFGPPVLYLFSPLARQVFGWLVIEGAWKFSSGQEIPFPLPAGILG